MKIINDMYDIFNEPLSINYINELVFNMLWKAINLIIKKY